MLRFSSLACAVLIGGGLIATFTRAADAPGAMAVANIMPAKAAATQPSNTNVTGTVTFTQSDADIQVVADITGLSPGKHGIHIHEKDDLSDPQRKTAGPHCAMAANHQQGGREPTTQHPGAPGKLNPAADATLAQPARHDHVKID